MTKSNKTKSPEIGSEELAPLRSEIDMLDDQIMALLAKRLDCCHRVAEIKRQHDIPVVLEERIAAVIERAETYANAHSLDTDFYKTIYKRIIEATCDVEIKRLSK
jgi:chorismate mutase